VLIYFDHATKAAVFGKLAARLAPHGRLFLGAAETTYGFTEAFEPVPGSPGVYAKRSSTASRKVA
jgi:chemotaxis methyl-accepting protein methylase